MSSPTIERLTKKDYEQWLYVLNTTFSNHRGKEIHFEKDLPKMCIEDDLHMNMHFGIKENGKLCALLGVYPLKTKIGGQTLMLSTVGNVATLPRHEGKGYMRLLMGEAMKELERIGADASRLGGERQRYNLYGYESCGREYHFTVTGKNTKHSFDGTPKVTFKRIGPNDTEELTYIRNLRQATPMHVIRSEGSDLSGEYLTLCAWQSIPKIALSHMGEPIGYIAVSEDGTELLDVMAKDTESLKAIIYNLQIEVEHPVTFTLPQYDLNSLRYFSSVAQTMWLSPPCHFKIINFDKVTDAFLKLKLQLNPDMAEGEKVIEIKDWGNILIYNKSKEVFCKKTDQEASLSLDKLTATRLLFGTFDSNTVVGYDEFLSSVLPLPLSWNTLDRV